MKVMFISVISHLRDLEKIKFFFYQNEEEKLKILTKCIINNKNANIIKKLYNFRKNKKTFLKS